MGDIGRPDPYRFLKTETPVEVKWLLVEAKKREIESTIQRTREDIIDMRENKIKTLEAKIIMLELQKSKLDRLVKDQDVKVLPEWQ